MYILHIISTFCILCQSVFYDIIIFIECPHVNFRYAYSYSLYNIIYMEYGSTSYVGLTPKKHGRHTLVQSDIGAFDTLAIRLSG